MITKRKTKKRLASVLGLAFADGHLRACQVTRAKGANEVVKAASAALTISGVPFMGPIGAARVGYIDGGYVVNPTKVQLEKSTLDLVVAGTKEGVLMVESEAKELSEEIMLGAVIFAHDEIKKVVNLIIDLAEKAAKPVAAPVVAPATPADGKGGTTWRFTRPPLPTRLTLVNGVPTFENGAYTGAKPGRFVKRQGWRGK